MNEIIRIEERNGQQAVSARELHAVLESKQRFSDWIKNRIDKYGFVEGEDFSSFHKIMNREKGATVQKEYVLSLDMAKEIAMVEGNARGRMVRKYFIEAERRARHLERPSYTIQDSVERAERWIAEERERRRLERMVDAQRRELGLMEERARYVDRILNARDTVLVTQIAQDYGMSAVALNGLLHEMGIQRRVNGQWILYADHLDKGYVNSRTVEITHSDGRKELKLNTEWTQKGRLFLYERLKDRGVLPLIEKPHRKKY